MSTRVEFKNRAIWIDGKKVQIISGAIHYFRVPRELWRDRLEKLRMCGLNCLETYICWNLHEPQEGVFDFSGMLDLEAYIRLAQELGLFVIVRPAPYICAEWDNGGLPAWIMVKEGVEIRRMNAPFLDAVRNYYQMLMPKLAQLQIDNGGPIIAMQVENEYGSYGSDKKYLHSLRQMIRDAGITVPLFTADGPRELYLLGGTLDDSPVTLNFGTRALEYFELASKYRPDDPPFCMEFWDGWFDHWEEAHHTRSAESAAEELDDILRSGGNVNFYMFHGGTNFGFLNGANGIPGEQYKPDITSYDYDAPLSESGDITEKYLKIQQVIKKYRPDAPFGTPESSRKIGYGKIDVTECCSLYDCLQDISVPVNSVSVKSMEELGQNFGFINYRARLQGPQRAWLNLWEVKDRALVYVNGKHVFTYYRNDPGNQSPEFDIPAEGAQLDILVENMGRVNYGPAVGKDFKGICSGVTHVYQQIFDWQIFPLPLDQRQLSGIPFQKFVRTYKNIPAFYRATLEIQDVADTFIRFPGVKGIVWVNGHNLGRYWNLGPGNTMYVPAPFLQRGSNEIVVFETEHLSKPYIYFVEKPSLE